MCWVTREPKARCAKQTAHLEAFSAVWGPAVQIPSAPHSNPPDLRLSDNRSKKPAHTRVLEFGWIQRTGLSCGSRPKFQKLIRRRFPWSPPGSPRLRAIRDHGQENWRWPNTTNYRSDILLHGVRLNIAFVEGFQLSRPLDRHLGARYRRPLDGSDRRVGRARDVYFTSSFRPRFLWSHRRNRIKSHPSRRVSSLRPVLSGIGLISQIVDVLAVRPAYRCNGRAWLLGLGDSDVPSLTDETKSFVSRARIAAMKQGVILTESRNRGWRTRSLDSALTQL